MKQLAALVLAIAAATPALAQSGEVQGVNCSDWKRERNGSWTATRAATVSGGGGSVSVSPGMGIEKGPGLTGDVAAYLERTCSRR